MTDQTTNTSTDTEGTGGLSTADLASASENTDYQSGTGPASMGATGGTEVETRPKSTSTSATKAEESAPLFSRDDAEKFRSRWNDIQATFVDDPRKSVEQADNLVAEVIKQLAEIFADERQTLESQWEHGDDVDTEDLRVALRRYRSFFDRLLAV